MNARIILIFGIMGLVQRAHSACLCGFGEGTDACTDGSRPVGAPCAPMVVRPAPLAQIPFITGTAGRPYGKPRIVCKEVIDGLHPSGFKPLRPIGDLCSCRQTIVLPANVPRPACRKCGGTSTIYEPVPMVKSREPAVYPIPIGTGFGGIPVDPVSLGIAWAQARKSCGQFADDRIFYGPGELPREEPIRKSIKSKLPERNLFQIKGVPIELIPIPCHRPVSKSLDDEALEDMLLESEYREEQAEEAKSFPQFTYDDLGFSAVSPDQPKFIAVHGTEMEEDTPDDEVVIDDIGDFSGGTFKCEDGYKPGNVIFKSFPHREVYVPSPTIPISCADEEIDDTVYPIDTKPYPVYPGIGPGVLYEPYPCDP